MQPMPHGNSVSHAVIVLANVNCSRSLYAVARPSVAVYLLSVTFVHRTQSVEIFGNVFLRRLVPWPSVDIRGKFCGDRPRETHPSEWLNARGVAK